MQFSAASLLTFPIVDAKYSSNVENQKMVLFGMWNKT